MMEHEQVNDKCVALSMRGSRVTGRMLAKAMLATLRFSKGMGRRLITPHGEQSLKSLTKKGSALTDIEISGDNIGTFRKVARKYNVDFALRKDSSQDPPRWIVFFEAKNDKAMQSAFNEYAKATLKQKSKKDSMLNKLDKNKELARSAPEKVLERVKDKSKDASL